MAGIVHQPAECTTMSTSLENTSRAVGGGLPASSSPPPLPHAPHADGGLSFTEFGTQTYLTVDPSHHFVTFSAKTCIELLPSLSDEQLDFEIRYNNDILKRNVEFKSTRKSSINRVAKIDALIKTLSPVVIDEFGDIFYECENYSYLTEQLSRSICEAKQFLDEFKKTCDKVNVNEVEETDEVFYDCTSSELDLPEPVCVLNFNVGEGLDVADFTQGVNLRKIGNRKVANFGTKEYRYGGIVHTVTPYPDCPALDTVFAKLQEHLPESVGLSKDSWSTMITLYENGKAHIPPHSDNEECIEPDSDIITVSIGATRTVVFQNIVGPLTEQRKFELPHGSVHSMSTLSQHAWEHSIPPSSVPNCGPRLSLTLRKLRDPNTVPIVPPIAPPVSTASTATENTVRPKRLLMLSDSIHISFDTQLFDKQSVICIKKRLPNFCLSDLQKFENEFSYTDFVFISCGINDLSRYGWDSSKLFKHFKVLISRYRTQFPNTTFVYNSMTLTKFDWLNEQLQDFNRNVFYFSLRLGTNICFFDSHHIAQTLARRGVPILETRSRRANGVHITYQATNEIRGVIACCLNAWCSGKLSVVSDEWPMRPEFRHVAGNR